MTQKRITLIINPNSGTVAKTGVRTAVPRALARMGYEVDVLHTRYPGHATELARQAAERSDYAVLACGGDGTVNEVASGLLDSRTILGILPAGSGNGLARHIGIPVDIKLALSVIKDDNPQLCDFGTVNGSPFFCTFGMGFDAAVSERFARKNRRGLNAYLTSALDEYANYRSDVYTLVADGQVVTERAFLIVVANASQYGNNAFIAPAASIQDGMLDVTIVHEGTILENVWTGVEMLAGAIGNHGKIQTLRARSIEIRRSHPGPAHIDGEPISLPRQVTIQCHPGRLRIFVPRRTQRFIPLLTPALLTLREWAIVLTRPFRK